MSAGAPVNARAADRNGGLGVSTGWDASLVVDRGRGEARGAGYGGGRWRGGEGVSDW